MWDSFKQVFKKARQAYWVNVYDSFSVMIHNLCSLLIKTEKVGKAIQLGFGKLEYEAQFCYITLINP